MNPSTRSLGPALPGVVLAALLLGGGLAAGGMLMRSAGPPRDGLRATGIAAVGVTHCAHTGRVGQYVERIAARGQFGLALGGGGHRRWANVAPYGGMAPALSTNPYALALPGGKYGAVVAGAQGHGHGCSTS